MESELQALCSVDKAYYYKYVSNNNQIEDKKALIDESMNVKIQS